MEEKNTMVLEYINSIKDKFEGNTYPVPSETVSKLSNQYLNSSKTFEEIKKEIDRLLEEKMTQSRKKESTEQVQQDVTKPKLNKFGQDFNYHTHTYRSGHSEYASGEEMLQAAKRIGIVRLGFSEHIPNPCLILPDEEHRMLLSEVDGYISSINKMKQENPNMIILTGFEAEYDPMKEAFLGEMRDKVDYMILGQHFVNRGLQMVLAENNPNYPIEYANMVSKAIESGIFDIIAHPDLFMAFRDTIVSEHDRRLFDENAVLASQTICEKARDMGIPIEINLSPSLNNQTLLDGYLAYPHPTFWKIAQEIDGLQVLKGIDAHYLSSFERVPQAQQLVGNIEQMVIDKLIPGGYNPVVARQNNPKLQEAYRTHQENALTFETHMITQIVNDTLSGIENSLDSESLALELCTSLNAVMQSCVAAADKKDSATVSEMSTIVNSEEISFKEKKGKLERKKQVINETNQFLANQQRAIENAKNNVMNAANIGCENKQEYSNMITQMTQHQSTKNDTQKQKIEEHISIFQQSKGIRNTQSKPYQLMRKNNNQGDSGNVNKGMANIIILAFIIAFTIGFGIGIGYVLYIIAM